MRTYKEISDSIPEITVPKEKIVYWAYKGGKVFECESMDEAKRIGDVVVERGIVNADTVREKKLAQAHRKIQIFKVWRAELEKAHPRLIELNVFKDVYAYVYGEYCEDLDEISDRMLDIERLINIALEKNMGKK